MSPIRNDWDVYSCGPIFIDCPPLSMLYAVRGAPAHLFIAPSDRDGDGLIDTVQVIAPPALSEREARRVGALVRSLRVIDRNGVRLRGRRFLS